MALLQTKKQNRYLIDEWETVSRGSFESLYKEMLEEYTYRGFIPGTDVRVLLTSEDGELKLHGKSSA